MKKDPKVKKAKTKTKTEVVTKTSKETSKNDQIDVAIEKTDTSISDNDKTSVPFATMCGESFDCKANSDCLTICKGDNPVDFAKCEEHFKSTASETKKSKSKSKRGKNIYGHLFGSQAELIDKALLEATAPIGIPEIAKLAGAKVPRTRHHIKHLQDAWSVDIKVNKEKEIFIGTLAQFAELSQNKEVGLFA